MDIFGILDPDPHENLCGSDILVACCRAEQCGRAGLHQAGDPPLHTATVQAPREYPPRHQHAGQGGTHADPDPRGKN